MLNAVLALVDAGDAVVLFKPYYFNHLMAVQVRYRAVPQLLQGNQLASQRRQGKGCSGVQLFLLRASKGSVLEEGTLCQYGVPHAKEGQKEEGARG